MAAAEAAAEKWTAVSWSAHVDAVRVAEEHVMQLATVDILNRLVGSTCHGPTAYAMINSMANTLPVMLAARLTGSQQRLLPISP
jgi:hypothetical protein